MKIRFFLSWRLLSAAAPILAAHISSIATAEQSIQKPNISSLAQEPIRIDIEQRRYFYDVGPPTSPLFTASSDTYAKLSEHSHGDVFFTTDGPNPLTSVDLGNVPGVNAINRDYIHLRSPGSFHHKVSNGIYSVLFTIGDSKGTSGAIRFTAENEKSIQSEETSLYKIISHTIQNVRVVDGELNVKIENLGDSAKITRIVVAQTGQTVDLNQDTYNYDLGTTSSPVLPHWTQLTPSTKGDIYWSRKPPKAADRGPKLNDLLRDFVYATTNTMLHHKLRNGVWQITLTLGDADFLHDKMGVRAEGELITQNITSATREFSFVNRNGDTLHPVSFDVKVTDGSLNLEFFDEGGVDPSWVLNRISIKFLKDLD